MDLDGSGLFQRFDERVRTPKPEEVTLKSGENIIAAFLPDKPVISTEERQEAGVLLHALAGQEPELLLGMGLKTLEEVRKELEPHIMRLRNAQ
jgi:hypothetical protein